jgi:hypothetical protein
MLGAGHTAYAQTTAAYVDSQLGDPIGDGMTHTLTPPAISFSIDSNSFSNSIRMVADIGSFSDWEFTSRRGRLLRPGRTRLHDGRHDGGQTGV